MVPPSSESPGPASSAPEMPPGRLENIIKRHIRYRWPGKPPDARRVAPAPRTVSATTRRLLRMLPWGLALSFIASFFWDFDGCALAFSGDALHFAVHGVEAVSLHLGWLPLPNTTGTQNLEGLLLVMSSSGLIGFLTNWLAVTLLFRPRYRRPIFGQGVIPAQRESIILRLAEAIDREIIGPDVIKKGVQDSQIVPQFLSHAQQGLRDLLADTAFREEVRSVIRAYMQGIIDQEDFRRDVADFALERLVDRFNRGLGGRAMKKVVQLGEAPLRTAVDRAITTMPDGLGIILDRLDTMLDAIPDTVSARYGDIEEWAASAVQHFVGTLDTFGMLVNRLQSFDEQRLVELIRNASNDQLNYIKYLGGALGLVGGLVIFERWLALPILAAVALVLIGLDAGILAVSRRHPRQCDAATS